MIIDAHAHVYLRPRIRYSPKSTPFLSVEEQIAIMDRLGIDRAVILPCGNPECMPEGQGIDEVLRICELHPGRFIPFCYIDPRLTGTLLKADAEHFAFLLRQHRDLGCRGLGEMTCRVWWDDPALWALLEACGEVGFPVTFHTSLAGTTDYGLIDEMGLPRFEQALRRFPHVVFLAHSMGFWAELSGDCRPEDKTSYPQRPVTPGGVVVRLMRDYPNLYGDLSANSGLTALERDPDHAWRFLDEFQDRLVFGLDYCSVNDSRRHVPWLTAARDAGNLAPAAFEKIMGGNIAGLLGDLK